MTKAAVFSKIIKYLFLILVVLFVLYISAYLIQKILKPQVSDKEIFEEKELNLYEKNIEVLYEAFENSGYWDSWDWESKIVEADIVEVDDVNRELLLKIRRPFNQVISDRTVRSYVFCENTSTVAVSGENPVRGLIGADFDVFDKSEAGDILMTYCMDEQCLNVGKLCILVKR